MEESISIWTRIINFFLYLVSFFKKKDKVEVGEKPMAKNWEKDKLLKPLRHKRYITLYCIADLSPGEVGIKDRHGNVISGISEYSLKRLTMEGTGRLEDGRVVNVDTFVGGVWNYAVMSSSSPDGLGIKGAALVPWKSLAHNKSQITEHSLFKRNVIIPSLLDFDTPDGRVLDGEFEVHDTGGGLRRCPYENGLWRTGDTKSEYGQFDLFCGTEKTYKTLLGHWNSYREVIVMPRDLDSVAGQQETLNLLMDAGLVVDNVFGPKTEGAIKRLQIAADLDTTGEWCVDTKRFVELSLNNWK